MGLGLVIIYRATDVVNFALASLATLGLYVAVTVQDNGVAVVVGVLAAVAATVVAGLLIREVVVRPLGQGQLFAALVLMMGVALVVDTVVTEVWSTEPRSFPNLVDGTVRIGSAALP